MIQAQQEQYHHQFAVPAVVKFSEAGTRQYLDKIVVLLWALSTTLCPPATLVRVITTLQGSCVAAIFATAPLLLSRGVSVVLMLIVSLPTPITVPNGIWIRSGLALSVRVKGFCANVIAH